MEYNTEYQRIVKRKKLNKTCFQSISLMCFTDRNSKTKWMKIRDNNPSNQGREVPKSRRKKNRKKRSLHKAPSASLSPISKRRRCREDARPRSRFIEEWSRDANLLPWKEGPRNWEMNVLPSLSKIDDRHPGEKTNATTSRGSST